MYNIFNQFKVLKGLPKKHGFKAPPSMPKSATKVSKEKDLKKNPGK